MVRLAIFHPFQLTQNFERTHNTTSTTSSSSWDLSERWCRTFDNNIELQCSEIIILDYKCYCSSICLSRLTISWECFQFSHTQVRWITNCWHLRQQFSFIQKLRVFFTSLVFFIINPSSDLAFSHFHPCQTDDHHNYWLFWVI